MDSPRTSPFLISAQASSMKAATPSGAIFATMRMPSFDARASTTLPIGFDELC